MSHFFRHENVKLITARDPNSRDWIVQHLNPNVPVKFYPDIAAALDYERKPLAERTLGIILRGHQSDESVNVKRLLAKALSFGYNIHNIVLSTGRTAQDDIPAAQQIADFPFSRLIIRDTIDDLTDEIAQCDLVVSQKFHGCVVALMMGIPCISLSGSDKFVSFLEFFSRDLFITQAKDPNLKRYLMEPMYDVRQEDIRRIKGQAREGLLYVRNAILGDG